MVRRVITLLIVVWGTVLLAVAGGQYVPRGAQVSYLSRADSETGGNAVTVMLYDMRHGLRAPLLDAPQEPQQVTWSVDGEHVAFYPSPSPSVLVIYHPITQTTQRIPLVSFVPDVTESLTWSVDGDRVALLSYSGVNNDDNIQLVNAKNQQVEQILGGFGDLSQVRWSPHDPNVLAFVSRTAGGVYVYDAARGEASIDWIASGSFFTWLPDGSGIIAYDRTGFITVQVFGEPAAQVATSTRPDGRLAWSPGGSSFLYTAIQSSSFDILRYDLDTGSVGTLAGWRTYEGQPAWSHDGRWVAYVATLNGHDNIMLYDTRRQARFRLLQLAARDWNPAWRAPAW